MPVDPTTLPQDAETLRKIVVDLTAQLDRSERLLRQLLSARSGRRSEQLSREQLALFAAELGVTLPEADEQAEDNGDDPPSTASSGDQPAAPRGRDEIARRNYTESTTRAYLRVIEDFARYFHRRPDQLGPEQIREYTAHLFRDRKLSGGAKP